MVLVAKAKFGWDAAKKSPCHIIHKMKESLKKINFAYVLVKLDINQK